MYNTVNLLSILHHVNLGEHYISAVMSLQDSCGTAKPVYYNLHYTNSSGNAMKLQVLVSQPTEAHANKTLFVQLQIESLAHIQWASAFSTKGKGKTPATESHFSFHNVR